MTPMIDVMLVLLIIFMLVIPAISAGFQAIPPQGTNLKPHPEEERDQVLGIDANGQYFLNKQADSERELGAALKAIYDESHRRQDSVREGPQGSRVRKGSRRARHRRAQRRRGDGHDHRSAAGNGLARSD